MSTEPNANPWRKMWPAVWKENVGKRLLLIEKRLDELEQRQDPSIYNKVMSPEEVADEITRIIENRG